tara:strand:+ start:746 stop:1003 length:258 start_codon:yes stop_codon:yes gene_type:complete
MADTDLSLFLDKVFLHLKGKQEDAKEYIANGNCSNMEDYKYITGQFTAMSDLELFMISAYNMFLNETYGNTGDTDYVETSIKQET